MYARVIVDISHASIDRTFEYRIPEALRERIEAGTLVEIPFGKGNRKRRGYVVALEEQPEFPAEKIKDLLGVAEGGIPIESHLIALAWWMHRRYGSAMNDALRTVLPVKEKVKEKIGRVIVPAAGEEQQKAALEENRRKNNSARVRLLEALIREGRLEYDRVREELKVSLSVIRALEGQGLIRVEEKRRFRNPVEEGEQKREGPELTRRQRETAEQIIRGIQQGKRQVSLIHGITGSGKTEVYLEVIRYVVESGKQVICLIPEIALTYQTVQRFYRRFGGRVSVLHSRMSRGERYDQYERAKSGDIDIMIGPRSALFTPFPDLGLIIIDEEHEASYKSENPPRYHAREVAVKRAELLGASVILGSATPSLESYEKALRGEYQLYRLPERAGGGQLPQVYLADLREELKAKNKSVFSRKLRELMEDRLSKGQQIMLFLNRRGYAGFVSCRSCGHVLKCPHCDVSLTAHGDGSLHCHYCGHREQMPDRCPDCGSPYIAAFGLGTQKAEQLVKQEFPAARVLRMDLDTTGGKDGHRRILEAFARKEADILLGTQMIVKGHDFPSVTLVGILAADLSLYSDDYRSAERTFQLVSQAAGRAGRGTEPGAAVIQTYHPDHYSITAAARHDYEAFYEQEMAYRRLMHYPPAGNMLVILLTGEEEGKTEAAAAAVGQFLAEEPERGFVRLGPSRGTYGKLQDTYRQVIYVKHDRYEELILLKERLEEQYRLRTGWQVCRMAFDFNPVISY